MRKFVPKSLLTAIWLGLSVNFIANGAAYSRPLVQGLKRQNSAFCAWQTLKNWPCASLSTMASENPLARIKLLYNQYTHANPKQANSTLLHGAMFSEFGINKALYTLLVSPKETILDNGQVRLVPDESFSPLGQLLQQFFYLAGNTLAPTKRTSSCVYHLNPTELGLLYKAVINHEITADFNPSKRSAGGGKAKKAEYEQTRAKLMNILLECQNNQSKDLQTIYPNIIRSYFWDKFVIQAPDTATAQDHITQFNLASGTIVEKSITSQETSLEKACIQRLIDRQAYQLPKPPIQGSVTLSSGHRFPDCGESGIRGFFQAAFYDQKNKVFKIPTDNTLYDPQLIAYFEKYPNLTAQNTATARNEWGELLSNRPGLSYNNADICDLNCNFNNIVAAFAQLAPGIFQQADYANPEGTKLFLVKLANIHNLKLIDFKVDQNNSRASWKIMPNKSDQCALVYNTKPGHLSCELHTVQSKQSQLIDPILGFADALSKRPLEPDQINTLAFAAARMAQQQDYVDAYLALLPNLSQLQINQVTSNITNWGLLTPENARILKNSLNTPNDQVIFAFNNKFKNCWQTLIRQKSACPDVVANDFNHRYLLHYAAMQTNPEILNFLLKAGANPNVIDNQNRTPLIYAAGGSNSAYDQKSNLVNVKALIAAGADINHVATSSIFHNTTALYHAAVNGDLPICKYLIEHGAQIIPDSAPIKNAFCQAAAHGHIDIVKLLLKYKIDINSIDQYDLNALSNAAQNGKLAVCRYLIEHGAKLMPDGWQTNHALCRAAANGHLEIVKLLLEHGVNINATDDKIGYTALMQAVIYRNLEIVKLLVEKGANLETVTKRSKQTALSLAKDKLYFDHDNTIDNHRQQNSQLIYELLLEKQKELNLINKTQNNPKIIALSYYARAKQWLNGLFKATN